MVTVRKALMLLSMGAIAVMTMAPTAMAEGFKKTQSTLYITKQTPTSKSVGNVHNVTVNSCGFTNLPSNILYSSNGTIPIFSKSFSFVKSDSGVIVNLLNQERLNSGIIEVKLNKKSLTFNSPKQEALQKEFFTACY